MFTYDRATIDSAGTFLIGELERLDPTMHEPLYAVTWSRDIDLREDVSIADETSSFTNTTFAAAGGVAPNGKNWIGKDSNAITGIALDIGKTASPLYLWGMELGYTIPELLSAQQIGRPIDTQKLEGIKIKHNMDIDEMVYVGDSTLGKYGLINSTSVTTTGNVAAGAATTRTWVTKTPMEIVYDINTLIETVWAASGHSICPTELRLPPTQFAYIAAQDAGIAGAKSILTFIEENCIALKINGTKINIQPVKWLEAANSGLGTQRMVAYTKEKNRIRFPLVPLQRTPLEYRSIWQLTTYFGRLGVVEIPYPETIGYADGI